VSLGSLLGSATVVGIVALLVILGVSPPAVLLFGVISASIVFVAHKDNIARLLRGTERKVEFGSAQRG
ncbi:MAG: glycerol-3-phosphate 1-O-acyltransferase PlsY, partial [Candidatus Limnocylindrales bacterium]